MNLTIIVIFCLISGFLLILYLLYWSKVSKYLVPEPDPTKQMEQMVAHQEYLQAHEDLNRPMMKPGEISEIMDSNQQVTIENGEKS